MRTRSSTAAAAALVLLAAGCGGPDTVPAPDRPLQRSVNPIIGGSVDSGHYAVALIYEQTATYPFLCSGTLIAPNVILTAGHCTLCGPNLEPQYPGDPTCPASGYQVYGGTDPFNQGPTWTRNVVAVHHPSNLLVQTGAGGQIAHDVGILILASAPPGVSPLPWQSTTDDAAYSPGTAITLVGYGVTDNNDTNGTTAGVKHVLNTTITQEYTDGFEYGTASENTCEGDSGGPALSGGKVIGTTSFGTGGSGACGTSTIDMRTDHESAFISGYANGGSGSEKPHGGCKCDLGDGAGGGLALFPALMAAGALVGTWRRRRVS